MNQFSTVIKTIAFIAVAGSILAGCGSLPKTAMATPSHLGRSTDSPVPMPGSPKAKAELALMKLHQADQDAKVLGDPSSGPPVTDRKPDETGCVFVPMFHHLGPGHGNEGIRSLYVTPTQFLKFLSELDSLGFRPVTANQYLTGQMHLPPGATPVVMTFDDSNTDQLQMYSNGKVKPNCFVGLWMKFAKTHPEFPVHGTFFVLPHEMFGQRSLWPKKEALLRKLGSEMANHTMTHPFLSRLSTSECEYQIGAAALRLYKLKMPNPSPLALPYGVSPRDHNLYFGFTYKGVKIHLTGVFLVGSAPAYSPFTKKFNRFHVNRIDGATTTMGLAYWLNRVKYHHLKVYVQAP